MQATFIGSSALISGTATGSTCTRIGVRCKKARNHRSKAGKIGQGRKTSKPASLVSDAQLTSCVTDRTIYVPPSAPVLPPAGSTYVDPTFGTTILRITDETDGKSNQVAYSYWPSFNLDSSRLLIFTGNLGPTLYEFDADAFAVLREIKRTLPPLPSGIIVRGEDATWSGSDPNILFACEGLNLWRYNVSRNRYTLLNDFSSSVAATELWQMSVSRDDRTFAFSLRNASEEVIGYAVWQKNRGIVLNQAVPIPPNTGAVDEVRIDKTGNFLVVAYEDSKMGMQVWEVGSSPPASVTLADGAPGYAPGHYDLGRGTMVGHDDQENRLTIRNLSSPLDITTVLDLGCNWSRSYHVSMLADDEANVVISIYDEPDNYSECPTAELFRDEILKVSTDGAQSVCRLGHHRSLVDTYEDEPHANISRDGRFVAYTSNWGSSKRRDVFVVRIS